MTRMLTATTLLACTGVAIGLTASESETQLPDKLRDAVTDDAEEFQRNIERYNTDDGLALKGYDPVAYFPEGGGEAAEGRKDITHTFRGVTYRFTSEEHREMFKENPLRYEPAYGGWCATAMAKDERLDIDPETYRIDDGRLFVFFNRFFGGNAAKPWDKNPENLEDKADQNWKMYSGERPRFDGEVVPVELAVEFE